MAISSPGIGSNLDVNGIVSKLMQAEAQPLTALDKKEATFQAKLTAYGTLRGALSSFQSALSGLNSISKFQQMKASVADSTIVSASATSVAAAGTYSVEVTGLAQNQKVNSNGYSSTGAVIGTGTFTIQYGTYDSMGNTFTVNPNKSTQTVTIDTAHNTLSGIRDAINSANIGVSATIVNDGTASGNRLVVTSKDSGAANSLKITVADGSDGSNTDASGLSQLAFDPTALVGAGKNMTEITAAKDATLKVDGISMTKSTNTVTDAINGVTLNLAKVAVGTPTNVTVSRDTASITSAVDSFVKAYNDINKNIKDLTSYNPTTKQGGLLLGDSSARSIQSQLRAAMSTSLQGNGSTLTQLSNVGISFQRDGTLALDSSKLSNAINNNFSDLAGLFTTYGNTNESLMSYKSSTSQTTAGTYAVNVTQLATQGQVVGSAAAGLTINAGVNDTLAVTVNGTMATIALGAGTYASASALAAEVQSRINGNSAISAAGLSVSVSASGGVLTMLSNTYGSTSVIGTPGGNAASGLFGGAPTNTSGVDVAGSIGGSAGTGSGQDLTSTNGLKLNVAGGATGTRGPVNFSIGFASQLNNLVGDMLGEKGILTARSNGVDSSIKSLNSQREVLNRRLAAAEQRYRDQFTSLDVLLGRMQSTSASLKQQLASLPSTN